MKDIEIDKGWVVASMNGTFILPYSFERTRTESIKKWMSLWDESRCSWRKFKREGYKCIKATQTTELTSHQSTDLKQKFIKECTEKYDPGDSSNSELIIRLSPDEVFEWFKNSSHQSEQEGEKEKPYCKGNYLMGSDKCKKFNSYCSRGNCDYWILSHPPKQSKGAEERLYEFIASISFGGKLDSRITTKDVTVLLRNYMQEYANLPKVSEEEIEKASDSHYENYKEEARFVREIADSCFREGIKWMRDKAVSNTKVGDLIEKYDLVVKLALERNKTESDNTVRAIREQAIQMLNEFIQDLKSTSVGTDEEIEFNAEALWDEYSQGIGSDIDDLSDWANKVVMERDNFIRAFKKSYKPKVISNGIQTLTSWHFDCWDRKGKAQTITIEALNKENAIIIFKVRHEDLSFDESY